MWLYKIIHKTGCKPQKSRKCSQAVKDQGKQTKVYLEERDGSQRSHYTCEMSQMEIVVIAMTYGAGL